MNKKNKTNIGRYLPIAFIIMLLTPITNSVTAGIPVVNMTYIPPPPDGMVITTNQHNLTNPIDYGFTDPDGFFDGIQWRQSLLFAVRPAYNTSRNRLNGYTLDLLIYCPILPQTHSIAFPGNVTYIMDDDSVITWPIGLTLTWTTHNIEQPLLIFFEISCQWIYLTCKNIYLSMDYIEDGQFIRHVERSWTNRPFDVKGFTQVEQIVGMVSSQIL